MAEDLLYLHSLRPAAGSRKARTRVGRGEGSKGKTAGRGTKGTKARSSVPAGFEGGQMPLHMRSPKLGGFRNPFRVEFAPVNLEDLARLFPSGGKVTSQDIVNAGAARKGSLVKVLAVGDAPNSLQLEVDAASKSAIEKISAAGGSVVTTFVKKSSLAVSAKK